jgi:Transglycosylase SLT domain/D-alanyl-D-alanine carboxypeptidase/Putative Flp pilus-assembly TadE/G-like
VAPGEHRSCGWRGERGQASLLLLGVLAALLAGTLVLFAFGQALGARGKHQRAADLAAVSAAQVMRDNYSRLFEPPFLHDGVPNPRHLSTPAYLALARAAARRGTRRNGAGSARVEVDFPDPGFAPTRVTVSLRGSGEVRVAAGAERERVDVEARATAELVPAEDFGLPVHAEGGGYTGPLAYRQGKPMRPDVALAFDRMAAAARSEAGLHLLITSGYRSDAEQAVLWARNPDPKWVARPGTSLHRYGTELDLGPSSAYGWLAANSERFGFIRRYSWEPWHFGYARNTGSASVGFGGGGSGDGRGAVPSFVPERFHDAIVRAAMRWNVGAALISAQIYAESNFNPFAQSPAGAQGIAQFMPGTAQALGLQNPFDAEQAIDAQAHLMRDLLRRFGSVPLALAAYNAGPGAVESHGGIPPYPETRAYVAKILGLLRGAGDLTGEMSFEVRLVE